MGSCIVSSAADVLWMIVVRGMRGVSRVCEMCMCLARGGVGGEGGERIGFGIYPFYENRESVGCASVFGLRWYWWGVGMGLGPGPVELAWSYVCVSLDFLCRWQVQVSIYCSWRIPAHLICTIVCQSRCDSSIICRLCHQFTSHNQD